jgi:hypothetical protein
VVPSADTDGQIAGWLSTEGMSLTKSQESWLAPYVADLSNILFGSTVIGYVIPNTTSVITPAALLAGTIVGLVYLLISVDLARALPTP